MAEIPTKDLTDDQKQYILEHFTYDYETGQIKRNKWRAKVGGLDKDGYLVVGIKGRKVKYHRLVWFLCKGYYPSSELDHIDRNRLNNRIENLREVTRSQNLSNCPPNKDTGEKHIYIDKCTDGLLAKYVVRKGNVTKRFRSLEDAKKYRDLIWKGETNG